MDSACCCFSFPALFVKKSVSPCCCLFIFLYYKYSYIRQCNVLGSPCQQCNLGNLYNARELASYRFTTVLGLSYIVHYRKPVIRRVSEGLPSAKIRALGKLPICRVREEMHSAKGQFAECPPGSTRQTTHLPSVY